MARLKVVSENSTGRNLQFKDTSTNRVLTRAQVVSKIESGYYTKYHVRRINGIKTPVSNPDNRSSNNLG